MNLLYDLKAPKKPTNISLNSDLVRKAKAYKINLSKALEAELARLIRQKREEEWLEENREVIEAQNRRIEKTGAFSDEYRRF
jgi:antitoxin CcdA